jgi:hypothetical protein
MPESLVPEVIPTQTSTITLTVDGKPACGALKKSGGRCIMQAGYGTDHKGYGPCKFHMGHMKEVRQRAAREEMMARYQDKVALGEISPDAEPEEVLLQEVARSHRAVDKFDELVGDLEDEEVTSNRGRTLINQWNEQRRLLTHVSKLALAAGIAERQTQLLEIQALGVIQAINQVIQSSELELSPSQQAIARRLMADSLRQIVQSESQRDALVDVG